jgi:hypothetical protein
MKKDATQDRSSAQVPIEGDSGVDARLQQMYGMRNAEGTLAGVVVAIDLSTAGEIFKEAAKDPEREVIVLNVEVPEHKQTFKKTFSAPASPASWKNKSFGLGLYAKKYGHPPRVGDKVEVSIGEETGYYELLVD